MRFNIQDEISLNTPSIVEECHTLAVNDEEKIMKRQEKEVGGRN